jgi:hypothetical protein
MIKGLIVLILGIVGAVAYKLCIPVMFLLIVCKLFYAPYTWSWFNTIIVPLGCGFCGLLAVAIVKNIVED